MIKEIPFFGKEHEDVNNHIDEVLEIAGYFNVPGVSKDAIMLCVLPITFKDVAKS